MTEMSISSREIYIALHCTTRDIISSNYSHAVFSSNYVLGDYFSSNIWYWNF